MPSEPLTDAEIRATTGPVVYLCHFSRPPRARPSLSRLDPQPAPPHRQAPRRNGRAADGSHRHVRDHVRGRRCLAWRPRQFCVRWACWTRPGTGATAAVTGTGCAPRQPSPPRASTSPHRRGRAAAWTQRRPIDLKRCRMDHAAVAQHARARRFQRNNGSLACRRTHDQEPSDTAPHTQRHATAIGAMGRSAPPSCISPRRRMPIGFRHSNACGRWVEAPVQVHAPGASITTERGPPTHRPASGWYLPDDAAWLALCAAHAAAQHTLDALAMALRRLGRYDHAPGGRRRRGGGTEPPHPDRDCGPRP